MDELAAPTSGVETGASSQVDGDRPRHRLVRIGAVVVLAPVLVLVAALMTGPAPEPADSGLPKDPPPLALPSDVNDASEVAKAAAQLATGDLDRARTGFTDAVAEDHDDVTAQTGLILSRWRTTGPVSVERDLRQLAKEYPDSAFVSLHLGLAQTLIGEPRAARESLRHAVELGRAARDRTSLRMAQIADDLLHPAAFQGAMPLLVAPSEVPASERATLSALLAAAQVGDRERIATLAGAVDRDASALLRMASLVAAFDKGEPDATVDRLDRIAADPATPAPARSRAKLLAALASAWGGGDRTEACGTLRASAEPGVDAATRRLAEPLAGALCE